MRQIERYVDWLRQYYVPNRISDIQPVLIAKKITNKSTGKYTDLLKCFNVFNQKDKDILPIKYIEYELLNGQLKFTEITY